MQAAAAETLPLVAESPCQPDPSAHDPAVAPLAAAGTAADPTASAAAAAASTAAAEAGPPSASAAANPQADRNLKKKLRQKYLDILRLEVQLGAGQPLNAEQQAKLARKAVVAEQLAELGCEPPTLPALSPAPAAPGNPTAWAHRPGPAAPGAQPGSSSAASGSELGIDFTEAEVAAAFEALALGQRPPRPANLPLNPRPPSEALRYQQRLRQQNPGMSYFFTLPPPLPDLGVTLLDPMGAVFFELLVHRAEAGEAHAVKLMYQQLQHSAEKQGMPLMQVRVQLLVEYGLDPVTGQAFEGTDEQALAWVESITPPAQVRQARKAFERLAESLLLQQMGGGGGGGMRGGQRNRRR